MWHVGFRGDISGRTAEAVRHLERWRAIAPPEDGTGYFYLGVAYERTGDLDAALAAYDLDLERMNDAVMLHGGALLGRADDALSGHRRFREPAFDYSANLGAYRPRFGGREIESTPRSEKRTLTRGTETPMKITVETTVAVPIEAVWRAYTSPEDIKQWNAASDDWHTTAATVDLRVGGAFSSRMEARDGSMGFDFAGTYTNIVKHKLIEYSFGDREARVEFSELPEGVKVRVTFDSETTHSVEQQREGWQAILDNFARHVQARA